jgi:hypothetical protein
MLKSLLSNMLTLGLLQISLAAKAERTEGLCCVKTKCEKY